MTSSLMLRLMLAVILVVNGVGSALAGIRVPAAPVSSGAAVAHPAHSVASGASAAMPSCHEAAAGTAASLPADAAPVAQADGASEAASHGHCCQDACHCVCTLQAHDPGAVPAPVPLRAVTGLSSLPGWAAPDPTLLLRPPIA